MRLWPRRHGTALDLLVVGLGNPGREYARNRHNAGWLVVDELARRHGGSWRAKFDGQLAEIRIDGHKVALLKPETFMNDSGRSVQAAARFFKVEPDSILVVHDEGDLELGRLQAGSAAGSPATTACARSPSTSATPDFLRLRIGVGRPGSWRPAAARRLPARELRASRRSGCARRRRGRRRRAPRRRRARGGAADDQQPLTKAYDDPRPNASFGPSSWTGQFSTASSSAYAPGAPPGIRGGAADARPRLRAGAAARARLALRRARPRARRRAGRGRGRARRRRGGRLVPRRRVVALFPSRGVRWESGLEPPPHLVGERARALDVLERGGLVCVSAAALAEGMPPGRGAAGAAPRRAGRRARASTRSPSSSPTRATSGSSESRSAASSPCAAGSSTSIRRPAASRSGSSSSATRSSRSARSRRSRSARCARSRRPRSIPAAERRGELVEIDLGRRRRGRSASPTDLVAPFDRAPDLVWAPDEVRGRLGGGGAHAGRRSTARPSSRRCRRASRSRSTHSARRSRRAGSRRPRTS